MKEIEEPIGTCPICTINLYGASVMNTGTEEKPVLLVGRPAIIPCGINRKKEGRCYWETDKEQKDLTIVHDYEKIAGLLGSMHGDGMG